MNKLLLIFLCCCGSLSAQLNTKMLPPFPGDARDDAVAVFHEGKLYAGFGLNAGFAYTNDWWQYDTLSKAWQQLAHSPMAPRQYVRYFVIEDSLYLFGGTNGTDSTSAFGDFWLYSISENRWEKLENPPFSARWAGVGFNHHGLGYLGLGTNGHENFNDFWRFNPHQRKWERLPDFPGTGRAKCVALAGQTKSLLAGGLTEDDTLFTLHKDLWFFDFLRESWSLSANMLQAPSAYHYAAADDQHYYILGGFGKSNQMDTTYAIIQVLDKQGATLRSSAIANLPFRRGGNMVPDDEGRFYLLWGLNSNFVRINDFYKINFRGLPTGAHTVSVFPNPTDSEKIWLEAKCAYRAILYDLRGQVLKTFPLQSAEQTHLLNLAGRKPGFYLLRLEFMDGGHQLLKLHCR